MTTDVLLGNQPKRARQIAQKLLLAQGTRDRIGLGFVTVAAIVDGWWRARASHARGDSLASHAHPKGCNLAVGDG